MTHDHEYPQQTDRHARRGKWVLIGFLAVGAFFLLTEHRAHLFGALPYLLLLACPLMHLFHGHGAHGAHGDGRAPAQGETQDTNQIHHTHEKGGEKS